MARKRSQGVRGAGIDGGRPTSNLPNYPTAPPAATTPATNAGASVTQDNTVYQGLADANALRQARVAGTQLYQIDNATGQLVPAGSQGTQGDRGYYIENNNATQALTTRNQQTVVTQQQQQTTANNEQVQFNGATATLSTFLQGIPGLAQLDPSNVLGQWINSQAQTLAGQGLSSSDITGTIEATINNPTGNTTAKAIFDQLFPGYNQKIANGTSNANGSYNGLAGYIAYSSQINAFAQTAGISSAVVNPQSIGQMWAGNISAGEASARITQGYVAAEQAWNNLPGFGQYMESQGVQKGDLASYFLASDNATADKVLQQTLNKGITAGESQAVGFGSLSNSQAASLSAFLAQGNQSGLGGYGAVNANQVNSALTGTITPGGPSAAAAVHAGFENAMQGTAANNPGVVSQDQLLSAVEGNAGAIADVRRAAETRSAGSQGGGGYTTTSQGATGLGYGSQT